jgi:hypothetical protein
MNHTSVAAAIVRLFAIYLIVLALQNAGTSLFFFSTDSEFAAPGWVEFYLVLTSIAMPAAGAVLLWVRPTIVTGHASKAPAGAASPAPDARTVFSSGVALIGLYLAATSLVNIFEWLLFHFGTGGEFMNPPLDYYHQVFADGLLLLIGGLFFLGSSGITGVFLKLRDFGLEKPTSQGERLD